MTKIYETNYRKFLLQHTEETIENIFRTGVYEIANKVNGKRYIGSAAQTKDDFMAQRGFYVRWYLHISHLEAPEKDHHCQHLQRAWNKYGHENFEFRILEFCDPKDCIRREQYYLDLYWESDILYNTCNIAGSNKDVPRTQEWRDNIGTGNAQDWEFISPDGTLVKINNLSKFCKENNLQSSLMAHVYYGKRTHHRDWSRVGSDYNHYKYTFISPNGELFRFSDLNNFCKEHNLCQAAMWAVHSKKRGLKQYKGWHLPGTKLDKKVYKLISPEGELVETTNLKEICRQYNLNSGALSQMLLGRLTHHKGWTRPKDSQA